MSKLPHRDKAYVPLEKVRDYLLSETHPVGKSKAKFFRSLGYNEKNSEQLIEGLTNIARNEDVTEKKSSPYGTKYVLDGALQTPQGTPANIRTVWIIEIGEEIPRFVTAHP
ncbi:MAG: hypothetical protein GY801_30840 [bacterium]|nr:hypothetical protein [bacterium]